MKGQQRAKELADKLERLRNDYCSIRGQPFAYFFCPILGRDEDVPLCMGHIVNDAFPDSPRGWTVQRRDVDNSYGSHFESEFSHLSKAKRADPIQVITDKSLAKVMRPSIVLDGQTVEYYPATHDIPSEHSRVVFESGGRQVLLGFKIAPDKMREVTDDRWRIEVTKDFRLPALVSLLKSAYLTLFELLGYRYGCGSEGHFMGPQMLGRFFLENCNLRNRQLVRDNAREFFAQFANMVRPAVAVRPSIGGTLTDGQVWLCGSNPVAAWGMIVFIRTDDYMHAVLMPVLQNGDAAARFDSFLGKDAQRVLVTPARFARDHWAVSPRSAPIEWPAAQLEAD